MVPIHIVTHASQLPPEFLNPSPDKKLVIGFDCEGVDLCRNGTLCIMQVRLQLSYLFLVEWTGLSKFKCKPFFWLVLAVSVSGCYIFG